MILTFRVPNESATASVTGLKIQFPLEHPIVLVNPEAGSGWQVSVIKTALPKPVTTDDGTFTSTTSEIDWTGNTIPVGQFGEFNVLAQGIPTGTSELVVQGDPDLQRRVRWSRGSRCPSKAVPEPRAPGADRHPHGGVGEERQRRDHDHRCSGRRAADSDERGGGNTTRPPSPALILAVCAVLLSLLAVWLGRPRFGRAEAQRRRRRTTFERARVAVRLDRFLDLAGPQILALTRGPAARRRELFRCPRPTRTGPLPRRQHHRGRIVGRAVP